MTAPLVPPSPEGLPGRFGRPIKITILGAGSSFTPVLLNDILRIPSADRGQIALVDIDPDRLSTMTRLIQKLLAHLNKTGWSVVGSLRRTEVLPQSDYLVNCIEVSGTACVAFDNDIPLRYGVDQCIGDTIGPGGLFKALRTAPVFLDVLRDAQNLCPNAIVLNYTNPMSILCLAAHRANTLPVVGLCHSVQSTSKKLADATAVPYPNLTWKCAGINHLSWFTTLQHNGQDLYPLLRQKVESRQGDLYESDPVRFDIMLHFGAFVTESSGHLSEYLPYYRKRPDILQHYCRSDYRGESRFYATNWPTWRAQADQKRLDMLAGERPLPDQRSHEYASWIIEAREKNTPFQFHGNVPNRQPSHLLIDNLPPDGCVEVPCSVDQTGITPLPHGPLPPQMAHLCHWNMAMFDLAATACLEKSKEAAIHALMLDPLTTAVCTPSQIKSMALDLFEAEKEYLPAYK